MANPATNQGKPATKSGKKKAPKSKKPSRPAAEKRTARPASKAVARPTTVGRFASVLPGALREAKYVARTIEILDTREKKAERLNAQTKKQLAGVVHELRGDVSGRFEAELGRVKKAKVVQRVEAVPGRVTRFVDRLLDRVGLVRKDAA